MNRNRTNLACLMLLFLLPMGLFSQAALNDILEDGVMRLGVLEGNQYPFVYENNGQISGYEINLALELAKSLNAELEVLSFESLEDLLDALNASRVHLGLSKIFPDLQITQQVFTTTALSILPLEVVVHRLQFASLGQPGALERLVSQGQIPTAIPELAFYREASERILSFLDARFIPMEGAFDRLALGEFPALITDKASATRYFEEFPGQGLNLRVLPLEMGAKVVGLVSWQEDFWLDYVNIFIERQGQPADLDDLLALYHQEEN